jgi:FixJ family two-component response regulator
MSKMTLGAENNIKGARKQRKEKKKSWAVDFLIKPIHQDSIAKAQLTWAFTVAGQSPI